MNWTQEQYEAFQRKQLQKRLEAATATTTAKRSISGTETREKKDRAPQGKITRQSALKKADMWFSLYARATWAGDQGQVQCCTCGTWKKWKTTDGSLHCGHWQLRGCNATRFDLHNVGPQCLKCNYFGEGYKEKMRVWLENQYGVDEVSRVEIAAKTQKHLSNLDLEEIALHFRREFIKVIKVKGL